MTGRKIKYVAEIDGIWVALLGWHSAALSCAARDRWIGWSRVLQYQRLHLIANNTRFLILPDCHIPHLASKVLSLNLKRLSVDWQLFHGHPLLLAETFVDPSRFKGTCYRAANWQMLGLTLGYAHKSGQYVYHGNKKIVCVYPLHRRACECLRNPAPHTSWSHAVQMIKLSTKKWNAAQQTEIYSGLQSSCRKIAQIILYTDHCVSSNACWCKR